MITLEIIEKCLKECNPVVNAQIEEYQSIIQSNEGSREPKAVYMHDTAKEKLAELLRLQSRSPQEILCDALVFVCNDVETREIVNEIKTMENYAGYTKDEKDELNALKRFQFTRDQDVLLIEFLLDQFTKREAFLYNLKSG